MKTIFQRKVLYLTAKILKGKITTYGEMARRLKSSPRAVGQALGGNPRPIVVPCHRVVRSDGSLGGYLGGAKKKIDLLAKEGIKIKKNKVINLERYLYKF
jgi:methylated-DNA-[protein]-cysteine S-methyltransferase